jgi:hypothetical protein
MKLTAILTLPAALLLSGCASGQSGSGAHAFKHSDFQEKAPTIGMNEADVTALYGKPDKVDLTRGGPRWIYVMNPSGGAFSTTPGAVLRASSEDSPVLRVVLFGLHNDVVTWFYLR